MADYLNLLKADYKNNLIAKWIFDDTDTSKVNKTTIYDQSGNGNDLTSVNISYVNDNDLGRCAYFNGNSYCTRSGMKIPTGKKTIIIKLKIVAFNNDYQYLINSGDCYQVGHDFYINPDNRIVCSHRYGGNLDSNTILEINKPLYFKYSYDNSNVKIFIDNLAIPDASLNTTVDTTNNTNYFHIGTSCNNTYYFKGYIQSIEIYNEVVEHADNAYLIKDNGKLYSFKEDEYVSPSYNEIIETLNKDIFFNKGEWDISKLLKEITIDNETFQPISKFVNPQIISYIKKDLKITGIKSNLELIISTQNLSLISAEKVNAFKQIVTKVNNGNCKTVFSLDNGTTWKSYDTSTSQFIDLSSTFPLANIDKLDINNLSEENQTKWDALRDEIYEKGIDADTMSTLDFTTLLGDTYKNIRFAHVLYRPTVEDVATLQNISWNIDEKGKYRVTNDITLDVDSTGLTATSTEDMQNVKINLLI